MRRRCRPLLGTFVEIVAEQDQAVEAAFAAVGRVHRLMSAHEPDSDVSRINRAAHCEWVAVDAWTAAVIERALYWWEQSEGAFDVLEAGKAAIDGDLLPRHPDQPLPVSDDMSVLELENSRVRLSLPATIDLGGIAKGFAVDRAVDALRAGGALAGLVNAGGDMRGFGGDWPVQVRDPATQRPVAEIGLNDRALASSASIDGSMLHICNPDERWRSVTVCAPIAIDADALTKIVLAASPVAAKCLRHAEAQAFGITVDGTVEALPLEKA